MEESYRKGVVNQTRLIEFGRYAAEQRKRDGKGKPETFHFLGFTHICGTIWKSSKFTVKRKTVRKRMTAKLQAMGAELRRRMHRPIVEVGTWLRRVVTGYYNYHAVPGNERPAAGLSARSGAALAARAAAAQPTRAAAMDRLRAVADRVSAVAQCRASLSFEAVSRQISKTGAVCGSAASTDLCGGRRVTVVPTATRVAILRQVSSPASRACGPTACEGVGGPYVVMTSDAANLGLHATGAGPSHCAELRGRVLALSFRETHSSG